MKRKMITFIIATIALPMITLSQSAFHLVKACPLPKLNQLITPPKNSLYPTWLGADGAASVAYSHHQYFWLFGDTLIGAVNQGMRTVSAVSFHDDVAAVHNSVGVMRYNLKTKKFSSIKKHFCQTSSNDINAVFQAQPGEPYYYWPLAGVRLGKKLLVLTDKVSTTGLLKILDASLFTVANPVSSPCQWRYHRVDLPFQSHVTWSSAAVKHGKWLYVYGYYHPKVHSFAAGQTLFRIKKEDALKGLWSHRQLWTDKGWKRKGSPALIKGLPGVTEMTVNHNAHLGWYSAQMQSFGHSIHLYVAKKLSGPWHDKGVIYQVPKKWLIQNSKGQSIFNFYAVKAHPMLATDSHELVLTYNINLNALIPGLAWQTASYVSKYPDFYVPQFVGVWFK